MSGAFESHTGLSCTPRLGTNDFTTTVANLPAIGDPIQFKATTFPNLASGAILPDVTYYVAPEGYNATSAYFRITDAKGNPVLRTFLLS